MTPANTFYIALAFVMIFIIFSCLFGSCRQELKEPFFVTKKGLEDDAYSP